MDKQIIGWSLKITREDNTEENIIDIPDWCASVVDEFLTELELDRLKKIADSE